MATNNLTAQDVVLDLLGYIGVTGFTPPDNDQALNQPGLDAADINKAIASVNSAFQAVQRRGPNEMKEDQRSVLFVAPTTLTLSIAHGTKVAVATAPPPAGSKGCSIMIDGDADMNRIMTLPTPGNNLTFLRGYLGPTNGAVSATIYYDCASLSTDIQAVESPVYGTGKLELIKARDLQQFERLRSRCWLDGWPNGYVGTVQTIANQLGTPALYRTERQRDGTVFIRVTPIPPSDFEITFPIKERAERITATVLDTNGGADPGYYFTSLHDDEVESLLLPIARWRFVQGHPSVKNAETAARLKNEYDEVMSSLDNGQSLVTETASSSAEYI